MQLYLYVHLYPVYYNSRGMLCGVTEVGDKHGRIRGSAVEKFCTHVTIWSLSLKHK